MPRQIKFNCVHCGTKLAVPPQMAGVSDHCPKCGGLITSPTLAEWQASLNAAANASPPDTPRPSSPTTTPTTSSPGWSSKELTETFHPPQTSAGPAPSPSSPPPRQPEPARQAAEPSPVIEPKPAPSTSSGVSSIRIKAPQVPSATPPAASSPPSPSRPISSSPSPSGDSPSPPAVGQTILSRMLSNPQTIKKTASASDWSSSSASASASKAESGASPLPSASVPSERTSHPPPGSPIFSDSSSENPEAESSASSLGMGEALAQGTAQNTSKDRAEPLSKPWRSTPFLSGQEAKKSKHRRPFFLSRKFLKIAIYVLVIDAAILAFFFPKPLVKFWHTHISRTAIEAPLQPPQSPVYPAAPSVVPAPVESTPGPAGATPPSSEKLPPPEAGPADFPSPPTSQSGSTPFQPAMPETPGDLPPVATANTDARSSPSSPVPQAIPITEEQLANLPPSSLGMTPPAASAATAPPPTAAFEVAAKTPDSPPPPTEAKASAPAAAPAAPDAANAPFAVSDAWVFPQATGSEKFETPPKTAPQNTSPAATMVETLGPGGLPPPPPDMALPNGPPPSSDPAPTEPTPVPVVPPSATTSSPAEPTTNRIPPEAKSAYDSLLTFLNATDWRERSKSSLRAAQLGDAMGTHAKQYGDGPIRVERIDFLERHAKTTNSDPYCMFELQGGDLSNNVLVLVAQPNKGRALVDWESFTEFRHDYLLKFLQNQKAPKQRFRVMLRRKHYFDKDVPNMDSKDSFEVTQPNAKYQGHVFAQKGTTLSSTLATQLGWGLDMPVIIELVWKSSKDHHWVEILSIPHYGWRNS